jgi:single-strand DNA-binding protein
MAEGLNRVMLLGNLGADPELKVTQGGQAVLKLRLATTESYLDKNNTRQERTEWHSVTVWGRRGEALAKFLTKGKSIFVEGSLRTSSYEVNGEKRYRTEVIANNIILPSMGRGGDQPRGEMGGGDFGDAPAPRSAAPRGGGSAPPAQKAPQDAYDDAPGGAGGDDDIPF